MKNKATSELNQVTVQAAIDESLSPLPQFLDDALKSDDISSNMMVGTNFLVFREVLIDRPLEELINAFKGLKQLVLTEAHPSHGMTSFRELQMRTSIGQNYQIDGFPDAKDIELFAALGMLLVNERGKTIRAEGASGNTDLDWLAENEAQIIDVGIACIKIRKSYLEGVKEAVVANSRKAGLNRNKFVQQSYPEVIALFEKGLLIEGNTFGQWGALKEAYDGIYKTLVDDAQKRRVEDAKRIKETKSLGKDQDDISATAVPARLTVERVIRKHRKQNAVVSGKSE